MGKQRLGWEGKFYVNDGTFATPTWTEVGDVQDVNPSLEKNTAEVVKRGDEYQRVLAAVKSQSVEVNLFHSPGNTEHATLRDAFYNNTVLDVAIADGDIATSGTEYFRDEVEVTGWGRNEPVGDAMATPITLQSSAKGDNPDSVPSHTIVA